MRFKLDSLAHLGSHTDTDVLGSLGSNLRSDLTCHKKTAVAADGGKIGYP